MATRYHGHCTVFETWLSFVKMVTLSHTKYMARTVSCAKIQIYLLHICHKNIPKIFNRKRVNILTAADLLLDSLIGSFEEIPLLEASPISENLFQWKCAHFRENVRKCVHFHLICIKCAHFHRNAHILCKLDENARIFFTKMRAFPRKTLTR